MMASKDLGIDRNVEARGFAELFTAVFENEQYQVHTNKYINRIIRGFAINEMLEDECSVVECLDLSHTDITNWRKCLILGARLKQHLEALPGDMPIKKITVA